MLKDHNECISLLEQIRWNGKPKCPYCGSTNATPYRREQRYHCNNCFTSYSVTVGTLFHRTRVSMDKWFLAIALVMKNEEKISIRQLSKEIEVDKNTAMSMIKRIAKVNQEERKMLDQIVLLQNEKFSIEE